MNKIIWMVLAMMMVATTVFAMTDEESAKTDSQIVRAIAEDNCVTLDPLLAGEYFKQVFASEESRLKWLKRMLNRAKQRNKNIACRISFDGISLNNVPEPFIQILMDNGSVHTFFESGRTSFSRSIVVNW
ncbi:MAG: hypothetical protein HGA36_03825 [Candidatus Moranbacteria bacterium]|nr:hypothetical protein [Candidatus Moranbacteria bacterium]